MKRAFVFLGALIGLGAAIFAANQATAQAPAPGAPPAAARPAGKVAVFNVAKVMRDYKKWQYYAGVMNNKRTAAAGDLGKLRNDIAKMQEEIANPATPKIKQEELAKVVVARQREFEDRERTIRKQLDDESATYLRNLFAEVQQCVKAVVEANGFDVVFAYPDAITAEEMSSPLYFDLKMRPPAAMPFYVSPQADMTEVLLATLNKNFPPPVETTGATAPGIPPK